jgi:hypothetical protein
MGNADSQVSCYLAVAQIEAAESSLVEAMATLEKAKPIAATHHLPPGRHEQIAALKQPSRGR